METTIINHPCGNGSSPTYKNGDDWGMVYDCFTNAIPFCLPQTRDIHSTQLLDCATVRQLRVPQALASSRAYWECTVCGNQLGKTQVEQWFIPEVGFSFSIFLAMDTIPRYIYIRIYIYYIHIYRYNVWMGMNIHKSQLFFEVNYSGTGFWPIPI